MTEVAPAKDATPDAQPKTAAADASQRLVADSHPAVKSADKPDDKPGEAQATAAQSARDAETKIAQSVDTSSSSFDLGAYISGAISSAYSYLPDLHLSNPATADRSTLAGGPAAKAGTAPVTPLISDSRPLTTSTLAGGKGSFDLDHLHDSFTVDQLLKSKGCDSNSSSCTIAGPAAATGADFLSGFTLSKGKNIDMGGAQSELQTAIGEDKWNELRVSFAAQTGVDVKVNFDNSAPVTPVTGPAEKPAADNSSSAADAATLQAAKNFQNDERVEKTRSGYKLVGKNGDLAVERNGELSIHHNADGSTSELNTRTGEEVHRKADGKVDFKRLANGDVEYALNDKGDRVTFAKDGKTIRVLSNNFEKTYDISRGHFDLVTSDTLVMASDSNLPDGKDLIRSMASTFSGKFKIEPYKNGMLVRSEDGSFIALNKDGSGMISIDKHTYMKRRADGHLEIHYDDNRKPQILTDDQVKKMMADPAVGNSLRNAFGVLRGLAERNVMEYRTADGVARIEKVAGELVGSINGVRTEMRADGTVKTTDTNTHQTTTTNVHSNELPITDQNGKPITTLKLHDGAVQIGDHGPTIKNGVVTTSDGTKYGSEGITFADGTDFKPNGDILYNGVKYNPTGEIIGAEGSTSRNGGTSDGGIKSEEQKAQAQVSQAEGMASALMARACSGHATAGDIAALYGAFDKLSALVGALAQFPDAGLMAAALMAKDTVSGSIEVATASLNRNCEDKVEADNSAQTRMGSHNTAQAAMAA